MRMMEHDGTMSRASAGSSRCGDAMMLPPSSLINTRVGFLHPNIAMWYEAGNLVASVRISCSARKTLQKSESYSAVSFRRKHCMPFIITPWPVNTCTTSVFPSDVRIYRNCAKALTMAYCEGFSSKMYWSPPLKPNRAKSRSIFCRSNWASFSSMPASISSLPNIFETEA